MKRCRPKDRYVTHRCERVWKAWEEPAVWWLQWNGRLCHSGGVELTIVTNRFCPRCSVELLQTRDIPNCYRCGWEDYTQEPVLGSLVGCATERLEHRIVMVERRVWRAMISAGA